MTQKHFYISLLAIQFCVQPILSQKYIDSAFNKLFIVVLVELLKGLTALLLFHTCFNIETYRASAKNDSVDALKQLSTWTITKSFKLAGLPAIVYSLQNVLVQNSYQTFDGLTFSVLNQSKLFFTAFFIYILLDKKQTLSQIGAIVILSIATILLSLDHQTQSVSRKVKDGNHVW